MSNMRDILSGGGYMNGPLLSSTDDSMCKEIIRRQREKEKQERLIREACLSKYQKEKDSFEPSEPEKDWGGNPVLQSRRKYIRHQNTYETKQKEIESTLRKGKKHYRSDGNYVSNIEQSGPQGSTSKTWKSNATIQNSGIKMDVDADIFNGKHKPRRSSSRAAVAPAYLPTSRRRDAPASAPRPNSLMSDSLFDDVAASVGKGPSSFSRRELSCDSIAKPLPGYTGRANLVRPRKSHDKTIGVNYKP